MLQPDITLPFDALLPAVASEGPDMTRYLFACLVVLGLLSLGAFVLARLNRTALVKRAKKRSLQILDVLPIGRKQRLCVVRAYDRTFVLGVGEREVALVAELDQDDDLAAQALADADGAQVAAVKPGSFASLLRTITGPKASELLAGRAAAPVAAQPAAAPAPTAAEVNAEVERRAALAARDALLSILDERRAEANARRAQKATSNEPRKKVARTNPEPAERAPLAKPERRAEARPRAATAPSAEQAPTTAPAPGASRASASWVG